MATHLEIQLLGALEQTVDLGAGDVHGSSASGITSTKIAKHSL